VVSGFLPQGRTEVYTAEELLSVETYRQYVFRSLPQPEAMAIRLSECLGLVVADDLVSPEALPAFANSAMDGYAVRSVDVAEATKDAPATLEVTGEIVAGDTATETVTPGHTVRIMTGAPVPPGADAVVPVELTSIAAGRVRVHRAASRGEYVRAVGEDVNPGQRLLATGHRIAAADIALLAAAGVEELRCFPAPRVTIISTGDELVPVGHNVRPGQIRDSNSPMLSAMVRQAGGDPFVAGPVADDRTTMVEAVEANLGHADMVILTGGVSAGVRDLVADVVRDLGEALKVKVAMKPGMPQVVGKVGDVPVLGLPGNPVSAFVSFEVFVRPALRALQGRSDLLRPTVTARMGERVTSPAHKSSFVRVTMARDESVWVAKTTGNQGSHVISSLVGADGLAEIPPEVTEVAEGDPVTVHLLVEP
jgi:molybdopterin molybdotransferase